MVWQAYIIQFAFEISSLPFVKTAWVIKYCILDFLFVLHQAVEADMSNFSNGGLWILRTNGQ